MLNFIELKNIHTKTSRTGKNGSGRLSHLRKANTLQVFKTSKCYLPNRSKLKLIHDGCVHGREKKKKEGKFHCNE